MITIEKKKLKRKKDTVTYCYTDTLSKKES